MSRSTSILLARFPNSIRPSWDVITGSVSGTYYFRSIVDYGQEVRQSSMVENRTRHSSTLPHSVDPSHKQPAQLQFST
jgi:hypothetical protein